MSARLFVDNDDRDMTEVTRFPTEGWTVEESAEEGSASQTTITIPDPEMVYSFIGWRRWTIYEDESEDANQVLASGYLSTRQIGRQIGEFQEPVGRVWSLSLVDMNNLWDRRLNIGADTDRPAETDVERMTWLLTDTEEISYIDDVSLVSSSDPEDLDARDVARTSTKAVVDECSQQSGKNYWLGCTGTAADPPDASDIFAWYGKDSLTAYESPLRLSNDPGDWDDDELADGTSLVWPISYDAVLDVDPNRVYDGASVEYEGGAVYRKNTATSAFFALSGRDISVPAPEIKSATKARRRGDRMLADMNVEDEILTCTVEVPCEKATMIRAGMRIAVRATHLPNWENFGWARILTCSITPVAAGRRYRLGLKLQGPTTFAAVQTVTLVATNTMLEDSTRNAYDVSGSVSFVIGQVWRWTITNSLHASMAFTEDFALNWNAGLTSHTERGWGASVYYAGADTPTARPFQSSVGGNAPYGILPEDTGSFTITETGTGFFEMYGKANYGIGVISTDEQWTCVLERLS